MNAKQIIATANDGNVSLTDENKAALFELMVGADPVAYVRDCLIDTLDMDGRLDPRAVPAIANQLADHLVRLGFISECQQAEDRRLA